MSVSKAHAFKPYATCLSFYKEGMASSNDARTPRQISRSIISFPISSLSSQEENTITFCKSLLGLFITKYHILGSFKQQKFILSQFWKLLMQNQGVKALRKNHS